MNCQVYSLLANWKSFALSGISSRILGKCFGINTFKQHFDSRPLYAVIFTEQTEMDHTMTLKGRWVGRGPANWCEGIIILYEKRVSILHHIFSKFYITVCELCFVIFLHKDYCEKLWKYENYDIMKISNVCSWIVYMYIDILCCKINRM